jgi:hypothetical protein
VLLPERRRDAEFVKGLNEAAQIMTQHLAQNFIRLSNGRLASQPFTKLSFDHAEYRLNV